MNTYNNNNRIIDRVDNAIGELSHAIKKMEEKVTAGEMVAPDPLFGLDNVEISLGSIATIFRKYGYKRRGDAIEHLLNEWESQPSNWEAEAPENEASAQEPLEGDALVEEAPVQEPSDGEVPADGV